MRKVKFILFVLFFGSLISCSGVETDDLMPVPNPKDRANNKIKDIKLTFKPMVDILFVIDDSYSMYEHQRNLAQSINQFVGGIFNNQIIDYHIGVITSDMHFSSSNIQGGQLIGNPYYVTRTTPDGERVLRQNLIPGVDGAATEKFFDPVYTALSPPVENTFNAGFYREDAFLAIMFITDAEDQSTQKNADDLKLFLLGLKKYNEKKLITYGAIIPPKDQSCNRNSEDPPHELFRFINNLMDGKHFSLCDDFGSEMAKIGEDLENRIEMFIPLTQAPSRGTIQVKWGTQIIPEDVHKGWSYDSKKVGLRLGRELNLTKQSPGTELEVSFLPYDYNKKR